VPSIANVRASAACLLFFGAGLVLAVVTCGGILEERLSSGSPGVAVAANALVTFGAILALGLVQRRAPFSNRAAVPQALGAACGIVAVHLALRLGIVHLAPWMSEKAGQFVNDAVAVFSTLAVVWACARGLSLRLLIGALVVLTAYKMTGRFWHLDVAPHGFVITVQDFVVAQFVAGVVALTVFREMTRNGT
jgi:hypothetical protein